MTDSPATPNYLALVDAMSDDRPEYRHRVCLRPSLHSAVAEAKRALAQATIAKAQAEETGTTTRRKMGHVSPVETAQRALDAANAERDAHSVAFVVSPPTAKEEAETVSKLSPQERVFQVDLDRVVLLAGWQRTETLDGHLIPELDRDAYAAVLNAATTEQIETARRGLRAVAVTPDFN